MRKILHDLAEKGRVTDLPKLATNRGDRFGFFFLRPSWGDALLKVMACAGDHVEERHGRFPNGARWDHVSVSCETRTPTWAEMAWVKSLFFEPAECCVEYHPPASVYVNDNPNVLHIWRPLDAEIPMPPQICV